MRLVEQALLHYAAAARHILRAADHGAATAEALREGIAELERLRDVVRTLQRRDSG